MRINKTLNVDIRSDFCTRMRSLGKNRQEIKQLDFFLSVAMDNVNEIDYSFKTIG